MNCKNLDLWVVTAAYYVRAIVCAISQIGNEAQIALKVKQVGSQIALKYVYG